MSKYWSKQRLISNLISSQNYTINNVVQIGGNDGLQDDFLRELIIQNEWNTHILEPVDMYFESLKETYSDYPYVICCPYAILESSGKKQINFVPPLENHAWVQGCSTFYPKKNCVGVEYSFVTEEVQKHLQNKTELCVVESLTWGDFVENYNIENIDMIVMDTEGCEWEILQQISLSQHDVKIIILEYHNHSESEQKKILKKLENEGMKIIPIITDGEKSEHDLIAYRSE